MQMHTIRWAIRRSRLLTGCGGSVWRGCSVFLFLLGKYHALLGKVEEAKNLVRQAIKKDAKYKLEFAEDSAFDMIWKVF